MAAQAEGRILKELAEVSKDDTSGVSASVVPGTGGNRHLLGKIKGPEGTVYDGGVFEIDIVIPQPYPFEPPKMKFLTKIWHPNVSSQTGVSTRRRSRKKNSFGVVSDRYLFIIESREFHGSLLSHCYPFLPRATWHDVCSPSFSSHRQSASTSSRTSGPQL